MGKKHLLNVLQNELVRLDELNAAKRHEVVFSGISPENKGGVLINNYNYSVFNSNDYLGLRFNLQLIEEEHKASLRYGSGPGGVRFISGTTQVHKDLELKVANFHNREASLIFSSAFAANLAVISSLSKGQSKDSLVSDKSLILSDELNHRSIVDGVRVSNLPAENKIVFKHKDAEDLRFHLENSLGKFNRCLVLTDGIFSMLGEAQNLVEIRKVVDEYDDKYPEGVWLIVDDSHGVGVYGLTGRGVEEKCGVRSDILIGTFGKAFGSDGGYVVGDSTVVEYLREASSTYIYSNPVSPGTAAASLQGLAIVDSDDGNGLLEHSRKLISLFKSQAEKLHIPLAAESDHPIQPVLIADTRRTLEIKQKLFDEHLLVTNINYPVVPKGKDEIRIQLSALHSEEDIMRLAKSISKNL